MGLMKCFYGSVIFQHFYLIFFINFMVNDGFENNVWCLHCLKDSRGQISICFNLVYGISEGGLAQM